MQKKLTGSEIRQSFIDYFLSKGHTFVHSSSLVPGGDQTLLFTNAGMVQFKDVFLGTDVRPYTRAANSQKCMRVAGKHNDLDDVGRDDSHHTFFEMLGNWSFGDYYKQDAISWAWDLLTNIWGVNPTLLYTTCFKDDKGDIPTDEEAAESWKKQPGIDPLHVLYYGRKENFWEMAETGPCGPCSEIHIDRGTSFCNKKEVTGHVCRVNGDCARFLEIWNLVFIQYNRINQTQFEPLPAKHVDTGMGLDRIVAILQDANSNYRTDLFSPMLSKIQELSHSTDSEMDANFTPYRVIADHARAATFLIADGVIPGNTGRNYVCRMIIRRAARFGSKIGLEEPFIAEIAKVIIDLYSGAYPELKKNEKSILDNLTREEKRFERTVEAGVSQLEELMAELKHTGSSVIDGKKAFELYATHGLPLELTRDIAREVGLDVNDAGFKEAMEEHKILSGAGKAFGIMGGDQVDIYRVTFEKLVQAGKIKPVGVEHNPYEWLTTETELVGLFLDGEPVDTSDEGNEVDVIVPKTGFYLESGGQLSDNGFIRSITGDWVIQIFEIQRPAAGILIHSGRVIKGRVKIGDKAIVEVDRDRRMDIMRNHTATHLLHAQLHQTLGDHARQAGSLVAPEKLRFDFTHPEAISPEQLEQIEAGVNREILASHPLAIKVKTLADAMAEGAMALFGEKYGQDVRTVTIDDEHPISYELCGGTHVENTGEIGSFIIISEGSAAAGIRRIEAVTGKKAYEVIQHRAQILKRVARLTSSSIEEVTEKVNSMQDEIELLRSELSKLRQDSVQNEFLTKINDVKLIAGIHVLAAVLNGAEIETLRLMTDLFRTRIPSGVVALGALVNEKPMIICAVTDDLVKKGLNAGEIVRQAAAIIGGSGGGRPNLAQAGGKDPSKLLEAIQSVYSLLESKLG